MTAKAAGKSKMIVEGREFEKEEADYIVHCIHINSAKQLISAR